MTTEMQEIAITEEKPLLPGQSDAVKDAETAARILLDQGQEHRVETPHGVLHVTVNGAGNARRPAILTLHDVGMDSKSCFSTLFKFEEMQEIVKNFTVVHVNAPGQEDGTAIYPAGYQYASMDQVSEMLPAVLQYFNFRTIIGVGVGAGAYILSKFTLTNPDAVEGLVLINIDTNARGWMDWATQKLSNLTSSLTDQILSHLFSQVCVSSVFLYELSVVFIQMADAGGMPQLTQPSKLTEAFKYFIQGMGYMASSCMTRLSRSRTTSLSSSYSMEGSRSRSRTLSQGSQGGQLPPSPSHTMEVSC
ncbi:protein NDRG2 [Sinocyclocheilus anshuiensis]|uniref:protein NDRG2 n=1 Tax=Sinocyclocheilus anshuiensis TaxID=1608454 RepID=UPI0007BADBFF|nr:PREDICTED: protein NDRG2 [Sinocyclocheilus anshuiensis]